MGGVLARGRSGGAGRGRPLRTLGDVIVDVLLGALGGALVAASVGWLVWGRRADRRAAGPAPAETGPDLPVGVADVLAVLASTAIVVDLSEVVVSASPSAAAYGVSIRLTPCSVAQPVRRVSGSISVLRSL